MSKVDAERALELVEEGDFAFEEGNYKEAIRLYRQAAEKDRTLAQAYKGLFRAGTAGADAKAAKVGGTMYLKVAPNGRDASMIRAALAEMK